MRHRLLHVDTDSIWRQSMIPSMTNMAICLKQTHASGWVLDASFMGQKALGLYTLQPSGTSYSKSSFSVKQCQAYSIVGLPFVMGFHYSCDCCLKTICFHSKSCSNLYFQPCLGWECLWAGVLKCYLYKFSNWMNMANVTKNEPTQTGWH